MSTSLSFGREAGKSVVEGSTEQVVSYVRGLIERGQLRRGDRLPAERDLATQIGVSRPTVRAGLRALAAMGVVQSRHGSGTYIPDGPPALGSEPLSFLAALHGFTREEMYEARRILEVGAAGLAAERAVPISWRRSPTKSPGLFASLDDPRRVPGPRHQLPPQRRRGVGQPDRRLAGRDGLGALLRAAPRDGRARQPARPARRRRGAPPDLPGDSRAQRRRRRGRRCTLTCSRRADYQSQEPAETAPPRSSRRPRSSTQTSPRAPSAGIPLMSMFDLSGRTAVVVGGTSGIGRVLALGLADAGADVVVTGRRADRVDAVAAEIRERGRRTLAMPADVARRGVARAAARRVPDGARRRPHHGLRGRRHAARRRRSTWTRPSGSGSSTPT